MRYTELTIAEQLLLLGLEDRKGTLDWRVFTFFEYALAGALLAELWHRGSVTVDGSGTVTATGEAPGDSGLLGDVHRRIARHEGLKAAAWVATISNTPEITKRQAEELVAKRVLAVHHGTILLLFHRDTYPLADQTPEKELLERIRVALTGGEAADDRLASLLGIAASVGVLSCYYPERLLAASEANVAAWQSANPIVSATHEAILQATRSMYLASSIPFMSIGRP